MTSEDPLLTPEEVAGALKVSIQTLKLWRRTGEGPPWVRLTGRTYRYRQGAVTKWLQDRDRDGATA